MSVITFIIGLFIGAVVASFAIAVTSLNEVDEDEEKKE